MLCQELLRYLLRLQNLYAGEGKEMLGMLSVRTGALHCAAFPRAGRGPQPRAEQAASRERGLHT